MTDLQHSVVLVTGANGGLGIASDVTVVINNADATSRWVKAGLSQDLEVLYPELV